MNTNTAQYLQECRAALSAEQAQSLAATGNWAHLDKPKVHNDWDALYRKLAPLIDHVPASSEAVQALIADHYSIACRFYKPSKQAYIGLSLFYGENLDMLEYHNAYHTGMVPFLVEAMTVYAGDNL